MALRLEDYPRFLAQALAETPADILAGRALISGDEALAARIGATPAPVFPLAGRDALALGVPPGPEIGRLLAQARARWLQAGCPDAAACRAILADLVKETTAS